MTVGFPTTIAILLFGFGITNLSLGIIAEYLWRTFDAARKRPVYIIDTLFEREPGGVAGLTDEKF
jgi:dolichol-phosphate mannosyltransferase